MAEKSIQESLILGVNSDLIFNLKCKYCHKNLSSRQNLKEHTYIHTGEKPYACTEPGCNQSFRQGSLLSIHRKIHTEINKTSKPDNKQSKRCQYPKLTEILKEGPNEIEEILDEVEKQAWLSKIDRETFTFIEKYL